MKLAIMQPYLFPYIGYFQLLHSCDLFVLYDDVQYINKGWINRNRIIVNKQEHLFTFSLKRASSRANINERAFSEKFGIEKNNFLETLKRNYGNSPFFHEGYGVITNVLEGKAINLVEFIFDSMKEVGAYLGIDTPVVRSSSLENVKELKGQDKIIDICRHLNASVYINPIGGKELYQHDAFKEAGVELFFLKSELVKYEQRSPTFIPWLSIIDIILSVSRQRAIELVSMYQLVK